MTSGVTETSEASIDEVKLRYQFIKLMKFSKKMENLTKNAYSSFCSIR